MSPTESYYWDGDNWDLCSKQSYSGGCIVVTITASTHPTLSDLAGQGFGSGSPAPGKVVQVFPGIFAAALAVFAAGVIGYLLYRRVRA